MARRITSELFVSSMYCSFIVTVILFCLFRFIMGFLLMWILRLGLSFYVTTGELERLFSPFGLIEEGKNLLTLCI